MKNNKLVLFTFILVGLLSLNLFAQKAETKSEPTKCLGKFVLPQSIYVGDDVFADYLKVASLPNKERRELFSKQTDEQKANFIKVNLALQIVKRPNLTNEQKEFILDAISKVSADIYDKSSQEKANQSQQSGTEVENKAIGLFAPKDLGDFVEPIMMNKNEEVRLLQKYEDLLKNGMIARRKIAKEMPVNDRVNIWKVQLAYHLATGRFSKIQNEFILDWLTSLSAETFASRANLTKEEENKALEGLESKIFSVFTKEEGFAVFMAIGIQKIVNDPPKNTKQFEEMESPTCDCRWYCAGDPSCNNVTCTTSPTCGPHGDWICYRVCQ